MLQFAREQGCPWDWATSSQAGRGGHLQWALEHGCPWGESAYYATAAAGKLDVLRWAGEGYICVGAARGVTWRF